MEKTEENSMGFNCLVAKKEDLFVGHCLELDIVATASTLAAVKKDLIDLIMAQVDYAFSNDNLDNLYHPAPAEVWELFYACKTQTEKRMRLQSAFQKKKSLKTFVPPWITAKTCLTNDSCHV